MASATQDKADPDHVNPVPEEMSLPSAAIQRIIKSKLPEGVMIGKEAKVAFSKASSIFILYVTTIANDLAKEARRTTVTAQDVLHALRDLEFDEFLPAVEACLHAYKEQEKQKSVENAAKRSVKGGNTGADEPGAEAEADDDGEEDVEAGGADEAEPQSKRQRTEGEEEEGEAE
eukprot:CAMPEP_0119085568 /NCGR_PEP_ID=MMETSP1178-20130426/134380_1 /TAXON_ID=33656 /ORGANISM="unid sp, Strain CCMP2000" /LENGTH=173 /DNA_ID=CAMNT_0007068633 /DNA_START=52 /DNA_END=573 /DNA_ORIENTATION=+